MDLSSMIAAARPYVSNLMGAPGGFSTARGLAGKAFGTPGMIASSLPSLYDQLQLRHPFTPNTPQDTSSWPIIPGSPMAPGAQSFENPASFQPQATAGSPMLAALQAKAAQANQMHQPAPPAPVPLPRPNPNAATAAYDATGGIGGPMQQPAAGGGLLPPGFTGMTGAVGSNGWKNPDYADGADGSVNPQGANPMSQFLKLIMSR